MSRISRTEWDVLLALTIESFRESAEIPNVLDLAQRYNIKANELVLKSSIAIWEDKDLLIVSRTLDGKVGAAIRPSRIASALGLVLEYLDASSFEVSWSKEEIITDAASSDLIPGLPGWKLFHVERKPRAEPTPQPAAVQPVVITNNFTPHNNINVSEKAVPAKRDTVGWLNFVAAIIIGVSTIAVTLWLAGKI